MGPTGGDDVNTLDRKFQTKKHELARAKFIQETNDIKFSPGDDFADHSQRGDKLTVTTSAGEKYTITRVGMYGRFEVKDPDGKIVKNPNYLPKMRRIDPVTSHELSTALKLAKWGHDCK